MAISDLSADRFELLVEDAPGSARVLRLRGELDMAQVDQVRAALREAQSSNAETILLDIDELDFIDSEGLAMLVEASRNDDRERLRITRGKGPVAEMLALTGLDRALPFADGRGG